MSQSKSSPQPHLQIRHRRPNVSCCPGGDHSGGGDGSAPAPGEECRESLVIGWLESDGLEAGLEAFGEAAEVEVRGAEEGMAGLHAVKVGEEHVLRVLGAAVEFVDDFH